MRTAIYNLFHPFAAVIQQIKEIQEQDRVVREDNEKKIKEILATMNGEEWWFTDEGSKK